MKVTRFLVVAKGNDIFTGKVPVNVPESWSEAEQFKAAVQAAFGLVSKLSVEQIVKLEVYKLNTFEGEPSV